MTDMGPAFVSQYDRDAAAQQAALYADQVVQAASLEALMDEMRAQQQADYEARIKVARSHGVLLDYRETVFFGKPYAWVRYKGQRLRLLKLTQEGIVLPS